VTEYFEDREIQEEPEGASPIWRKQIYLVINMIPDEKVKD
jgi:hypothetical protein